MVWEQHLKISFPDMFCIACCGEISQDLLDMRCEMGPRSGFAKICGVGNNA
jgi:hypothetical protein